MSSFNKMGLVENLSGTERLGGEPCDSAKKMRCRSHDCFPVICVLQAPAPAARLFPFTQSLAGQRHAGCLSAPAQARQSRADTAEQAEQANSLAQRAVDEAYVFACPVDLEKRPARRLSRRLKLRLSACRCRLWRAAPGQGPGP